MPDQQFGYDRPSGRFRDLTSGRFVAEREVRDAVDRTADLASRRMGEAAARFRAGQITADAWLSEYLALIKSSQIAAALAAHGGRQNMTPQAYGYLGYQIKVQYRYARQMVADVLDGRQRLNGRLDARARLYGQAARTTYTDVRRRESAAAGMAWERNVLGVSEHCRQCVEQTERGWVPIGSLLPPGRRTCRSNCRCSLAYARTRPVESEAA